MAAQVLVNWTYALSDQTGFLLQRSIDSASTWNVNYTTDASTKEYTDSDVIIGGTYWYHVAATNQYGTGGFSNTASVYISGSGSFPVGIPSLFAELYAEGYKICGWDVALSQMTTASYNTSAFSEWDGVFNQLTTTSTPYPLWYFTGSSINGNSIGADETPDWPTSPTWQDSDTMTKLFWAGDGKWHLQIVCVGGTPPWWIGIGDSIDMNNPSGSYILDNVTFGASLSTTPEIIVVKGISDTCPDSPPTGPIVLTVNSSSLHSYLSWSYTDTNQDGFIIERSSDDITYSPLVYLVDDPSYRSYDNYVGPFDILTTYWYRVDAYNAEGTASSNTRSAYFPPQSLAVFASASVSVFGTSNGQTIGDDVWDDIWYWGYNNPRSFYVVNNTLANLTITDVQITGSDFVISSPFTPSSPPLSISEGETLTFTITDIFSTPLYTSIPGTATMNIYFSEVDSPYTLYFYSLSQQ